MPSIYSKISLNAEVVLGDDDQFEFEQWTDENLRLTRLEYGHAEYSVDFIIHNPDDELSPGLIKINNTDIYEGFFDVKKDGRTFVFKVEAKCKSNIHKGSKEIMDRGSKPVIESLSINGQSKILENQLVKLEIAFSEKKI